MTVNTGIPWTNDTWNPWHGCEKVSPGCKYCYMYREKKRYGQDPIEVVRSKTTFNDPYKLKGPLVFTCSWSDFFIEQADPWRDEAWQIIKDTPHLTYQILTKRPENILSRLPSDWESGYGNCWLGISAENQAKWNQRVPVLQDISATVLFISAEPLLEEIKMLRVDLININWVIVGGESGSPRSMNIEHARSIRDRCKEVNVPFFMKQLSQVDTKDFQKFETFPEDLQIREMPFNET